MVFDFSCLLILSRYLEQIRETYLVLCIDDNSIAGDSIRFWTAILNQDCHLGNLEDYWLLSILKAGHGTKKMP
jgi:hypothetical protein